MGLQCNYKGGEKPQGLGVEIRLGVTCTMYMYGRATLGQEQYDTIG